MENLWSSEGRIEYEGAAKGRKITFALSVHAYDPLMACATHTLPGKMPLEVVIRHPDGKEKMRLSQNLD